MTGRDTRSPNQPEKIVTKHLPPIIDARHQTQHETKMKLPKPSHDFELCPAGNHLAVCCRVIDIGTQDITYQGRVTSQRKVFVEWQIPAERTIDGEPVTIGKRYTLSSSEKSNLRRDLESWRGKRFTDADFDGDNAFDLSSILGASCFLSVVHNDRNGQTYADVTSVAGLPKGTPKPKIEGHTVYLSLEPMAFEPAVFESLSDKFREVIASSPEYRAMLQDAGHSRQTREQNGTSADGGDDIPF